MVQIPVPGLKIGAKPWGLPGGMLALGIDWYIPVLGYSIFYPYIGMEEKFPGSVSETFSKGVKD